MQQNSHSNSFSSFPNVPMLPTPPVFRPFFPNYMFMPPPCQFPSTFGGIPAQNSLEMRFPTSTPVPFPQVQQNMIPQANALFASSLMNYRPPNLLGQISGLGATSSPLQFPVSSHSPVSSSVPLLFPGGVNNTNINPFLNPQRNFAQQGNPSLPLPAAPPVKSLQWFQGHSIRKTK
ncbi:uncharacterized protein LOC118197499 [Stegodyphus dumicola]|uniref:uncharacterized protein LOC118197499 n=1 Tax=Stegodyphus dumicola TaxID=202533 RepID=UPI0015B120F8|nr:uncharacterized protein LOC118197499 [Stegodyphus dumicola]